MWVAWIEGAEKVLWRRLGCHVFFKRGRKSPYNVVSELLLHSKLEKDDVIRKRKAHTLLVVMRKE